MANVGFTTQGRISVAGSRGVISAGCTIAVLLFASQWCAYDVTRRRADPFSLYLWWSRDNGAVLTAVPFYQMYDEARRWQIQAARIAARLAGVQQDVPRMQLQPHFLFNTLQAATILASEDPDGAEDILLRFSELLRVLFDELHVQEIPPGREVQFLAHSMESQA